MRNSVDIQGYEGLYSISKNGEVFSYRRRKILKPDCVRGYAQVTLYKNGRSSRHKVHRLVAEAFIKNPMGFCFVNHKDENKQNNSVENLEWCTAKYNNDFGSRTKRSKETQIRNAAKNGRTKSVVCVQTGVIYASTKEAERETGIYHSHISRCCIGSKVSAGGYSWRYV